MTDIAIAHEKLNSLGGAQQVAFELARTFDAPIYTAWYDEDVVPDDVEVRQLWPDWQRGVLRAPTPLTDAYHMLRWSWVEDLYQHDTIILNKTNTAWFVPKPGQTVVHYVHSPPRSTFDRWHTHEHGIIGRVAAIAQRAIYEHTWNYPDAIVTNSEVVAQRLERYLDREADRVVHPPVDTSEFGPGQAPTEDYYLTLGRLAGNKNVPEIVDAAEAVGVPLLVAGDGPERQAVERHAGEHTEVVGRVSEETKRELYAGAKAFVMHASQEDFGLTPIEALASGTPVIGVSEGYTQHQITDGGTGILYDRAGGVGLREAIRRFEREGVSRSESEITRAATPYDSEQFRKGMAAVVKDAQQ